MASTNRTFLIGNLGRDPESRTSPRGVETVSLSLATTEKWNDKQTGQLQEATEWHSCRSFKDHINRYLLNYAQKGSLLSIEAKSKTFKWQDESGIKKSMQYFDIIRAEILAGGRDTQNAPVQQQHPTHQSPPRTNPNGTAASPYANAPNAAAPMADDDDIPF